MVATFHYPYPQARVHTHPSIQETLQAARLQWAPVLCMAGHVLPASCREVNGVGNCIRHLEQPRSQTEGPTPLPGTDSFSRTTAVNIAQTNRNGETEADEEQVALALEGSQERCLPKGQGKIPIPSLVRNKASKSLHAGVSPFMNGPTCQRELSKRGCVHCGFLCLAAQFR